MASATAAAAAVSAVSSLSSTRYIKRKPRTRFIRVYSRNPAKQSSSDAGTEVAGHDSGQ